MREPERTHEAPPDDQDVEKCVPSAPSRRNVARGVKKSTRAESAFRDGLRTGNYASDIGVFIAVPRALPLLGSALGATRLFVPLSLLARFFLPTLVD
jgi:hypothetical protein